MNRRDFVRSLGHGLAVVPLVLLVNRCGDDEGTTGSGGADDGFDVTSAETSGHTHRVTVLFADLSAAPVGGVTYTSTSSGHIHDLKIAQTELVAIEGGASVTVTSSKSAGHTHDWTIRTP